MPCGADGRHPSGSATHRAQATLARGGPPQGRRGRRRRWAAAAPWPCPPGPAAAVATAHVGPRQWPAPRPRRSSVAYQVGTELEGGHVRQGHAMEDGQGGLGVCGRLGAGASVDQADDALGHGKEKSLEIAESVAFHRPRGRHSERWVRVVSRRPGRQGHRCTHRAGSPLRPT